MIRAVADTHALIWYLHDDPRMSKAADAVFDAATAAGERVAISTMTLAEIVFLIERRRIDPATAGETGSRRTQPPDRGPGAHPLASQALERFRDRVREFLPVFGADSN
ncbi:MAG TPA: PIN domain-containing protein [Isosphaeraceae bacterium]|jgi:predicted nucleic acid-binding protein|nr:PIN domain-containing protein [Isosphaeraceae bacterium]